GQAPAKGAPVDRHVESPSADLALRFQAQKRPRWPRVSKRTIAGRSCYQAVAGDFGLRNKSPLSGAGSVSRKRDSTVLQRSPPTRAESPHTWLPAPPQVLISRTQKLLVKLEHPPVGHGRAARARESCGCWRFFLARRRRQCTHRLLHSEPGH